MLAPVADHVTVAGVATDDPKQTLTRADVRLWKYAHTRAEEAMTALLAEAHDLPVYRGWVATPEFQRMAL